MTESTRQELDRVISNLQEGVDVDQSARWLFEQYADRITQFFRRRGFTGEVCTDLTQEAFLQVFRDIGGFRREARFETWLFTILARLAANTWRRRATSKRSAHLVPIHSPDAEEAGSLGLESRGSNPADLAFARERTELLEQAVAELPPRMREVLLLSIQGLTIKEIARILGVSLSTVKVHLYQSRKRLRLSLNEALQSLPPARETN